MEHDTQTEQSEEYEFIENQAWEHDIALSH